MMKSTKKFEISCYGTNLPFKLYSIDYIWEELNNNKELFGSITKIEKATKTKIKDYYNISPHLKEHSRFFAYIKFCNDNSEQYGIVGGKTNYANPDLSFDTINPQKKDNRYARNFLQKQKIDWDETIIIVNHKTAESAEADEQEALFLECYLQRKFNLFDS